MSYHAHREKNSNRNNTGVATAGSNNCYFITLYHRETVNNADIGMLASLELYSVECAS